MSDSATGLQHTRFPCPSLSPSDFSNLCPLSQWCHTTSVTPFSSCPQSFPAPGSFPMSWLFPSGGQSIGASACVLPVNIQGQFSLGLTGLISVCPSNSQEFSLAPQFESIHSSVLSLLHSPTLTSIHDYWKSHSFDSLTFVGKVMSLLFNMLSRLVIDFLPRSKCLLISRLHLTSTVDFGAQKNKVCHCFHCFPIYFPWSDGTRYHDLSFLNIEL